MAVRTGATGDPVITEWVMAAGDWRLSLHEGTPQDVVDAFTPWDHVLVTSQRLDPAAFSDTQLKDLARYSGVLLEVPKKTGSLELAGYGLALHLGDVDGVGDVFETEVSNTTETFPNWIRDLLPAGGSITEGTLYSASGTLTAAIQWVTPRQGIDWVCNLFSQPTNAEDCEWRVNQDGTLDAGPQSSLWVTDPAAETEPPLLVAHNVGGQPAAQAVPLISLTGENEAQRRVLKQWVIGVGEDEATITGYYVGPATGLKDFHGNDLVRTRVTSDSKVTYENANRRAGGLLYKVNQEAKRWTADLSDFQVQGQFRVGDWVLVYDQAAGFVDTANEIDYRGDRIFPQAVRVAGWQWAVSDGMGVYHRSGAGVWTDLTDYVMWETPHTVIYLGDRPVESLSVDLEGEFIISKMNVDAMIPNKPTALAATADTYISPRGKERAYMIPTWTNPTQNTDGSTLTDLGVIQIRYRVNGTAEPWAWHNFDNTESGTTAIRQLDPDTVYELQAQARRLNLNPSGWTTSATVDTSHDTVAPSTPATPAVAGVGAAAIRVAHTLNDSGGSNLSADTVSLRVFIDTATPVTASADTVAGVIRVTKEMIDSGDKAIRRFDTVGAGTAQTNLVRGTTYYVACKAVDDYGNISSLSTTSSSVVAGDFTAPSTPTGLTVYDRGCNGAVGRLHVLWTKETSADLHHYVLRWKRTANTVWAHRKVIDALDDSVDVTACDLEDLISNRNYDIQIRAVDVHGNRSNWSSTVTGRPGSDLTGPNTPPKPTLTAKRGGYLVSFDLSAAGGAFATFDGSGDVAVCDYTTAITGDLDVRARIRATDYTPAAVKCIASQWNTANANWAFLLDTTGALLFYYSTDGTATVSKLSTAVLPGVVDATTDIWVRVVHDVNNGASGNDVKFYYSEYGSVFTQLGSTVTTAGAVTRYNSTYAHRVGAYTGTTASWAGRIYTVKIYSGISGTLTMDPAFHWAVGATSGTDNEAHTWTLTGCSISGDPFGPANLDVRGIRVFMDTTTTPTTWVGTIWTDYEDLANSGTVKLFVDIPVASGGTSYYARGKAYDWAGNPS